MWFLFKCWKPHLSRHEGNLEQMERHIILWELKTMHYKKMTQLPKIALHFFKPLRNSTKNMIILSIFTLSQRERGNFWGFYFVHTTILYPTAQGTCESVLSTSKVNTFQLYTWVWGKGLLDGLMSKMYPYWARWILGLHVASGPHWPLLYQEVPLWLFFQWQLEQLSLIV